MGGCCQSRDQIFEKSFSLKEGKLLRKNFEDKG